MWDILQTKLNFTLKQIDAYFDEDEEDDEKNDEYIPPSLKICLDCGLPQEKEKQPKSSLTFYYDDRNFHFVYCLGKSALMDKSHNFFSSWNRLTILFGF